VAGGPLRRFQHGLPVCAVGREDCQRATSAVRAASSAFSSASSAFLVSITPCIFALCLSLQSQMQGHHGKN